MKEIKLPMKKSFLEFMSLCEAVYDKDMAGGAAIKKIDREGRVNPVVRKKGEGRKQSWQKGQKPRMKAVGGGKSVPVGEYKSRKDIGKQRQADTRVQQPTKERGTAGLSPREQQKKAAMERRAAKTGAKSGSKDLQKQASALLTKKTKKKVDPNYKPAKASGMTRAERMKVTRKGETKLRNIMKGQETEKYKKTTGQDPDKKAKQKIMGRVHQRMST